MKKLLYLKKRERIFRAWDKFQKRMIGVEYNQENIGLLPSCDKTGASIYYSNGNITVINVSYNGYDIMEFIGVNDKNNKKIYEFDIVKWKEPYIGDPDCIQRDDEIFGLVIWNKEICGFEVKQLTKGKCVSKIDNQLYEYDTEFYDDGCQTFNWEQLEIVGNRFQDSELLKNMKNIEECEEY
jgi:uncharacterized phage protein (TIGR01671 family)